MLLQIQRIKNINDGTIGKFRLIENKRLIFSGYTLEPMGEDSLKPNQDRRIPIGLYNTAWHNSPKFKQTLPLLYNKQVSKDRYILIHVGNFPDDTQGCILLGATYDEKGIYKSKVTLERFLNIVRGREFEVEIRSSDER